jgi:hypothetical protein
LRREDPRGQAGVSLGALTTAAEREARLVAQLAGAEARAEKQAAEFAARDAERLAMLTAEQARTTQAIAAFEQLALKLEALAEARRPLWRRLVG